MASQSTVRTRVSASAATRHRAGRGTAAAGLLPPGPARPHRAPPDASPQREGAARIEGHEVLAESTPTTSPAASSTGRWLTPEAIIAMLASLAGTSASRSGPAGHHGWHAAPRGETAGHDLVAQVEVGDDAQALAAAHEQGRGSPGPISLAASRTVVCGRRKRRAAQQRVTSAGAGREPRMVRAAWMRRSRRVAATNFTPSGRSEVRRRSLGDAAQRESCRARVVNSGGRPVSRVGWPNSSPSGDDGDQGLFVSSSRVPLRTTKSQCRAPALELDRLAGSPPGAP